MRIKCLLAGVFFIAVTTTANSDHKNDNDFVDKVSSSGRVEVEIAKIAQVRAASDDVRKFAPKGRDWDQAVVYWRTLKSDPDAKFDREVTLNAAEIKPHVTWGTSPEMVDTVEDSVPDPEREKDSQRREGMERALSYMVLKPRQPGGVVGLHPFDLTELAVPLGQPREQLIAKVGAPLACVARQDRKRVGFTQRGLQVC